MSVFEGAVIEELVNGMVDEVVEQEETRRNGVVQVGGARLKELKKKVCRLSGAFNFVTVADMELEISKTLTTHPDGAEMFAEAIIDLVKKYKPVGVSSSGTFAGVVFESVDLNESIGLSIKPIDKIRVDDVVQNMEKMSQSSRSPLELKTPRISVKITYLHPPTGSGLAASLSNVLPKKKRCGRKRKFDTGKLLELITAEKEKRVREERKERSMGGSYFLDDEAEISEDDFEVDSENGDIEEAMVEREERREKSTPSHAREANKMRNNVSKNCLPHSLHQAFCYWRFKQYPTPRNRYMYSCSLRKNEENPEVHKHVFEEVEKMKKEAGFIGEDDMEEGFGWREIDRFQKTIFAGLLQIICFEQNSSLPFYRGKQYLGDKNILCIYLENGHFQGVRSIVGLLKTKYYCALCDVRSRDATSHYKCKLIHYTCGKKCPVTPEDIPMSCETCHVNFRSERCYVNHLERGPKGGKSRCAFTKFCKKCEKPYYRNKTNQPHVCGETYCHRCQRTKGEEHYCTMTTSEKPDGLTRKRVYYDIETRCDPVTGQQFPVMFMAIKCCPKCSEEIPKDYEVGANAICENCSPEGRATMIECISEGNRDVDVASSITNWIFDAQHKGFVCVAHNASGFDSQFILENLIASNKSAPDICLDGTKLIYLNHKGVRLVDSMKFLMMSLSELGKTFEIDSLKGDFPVHFILPENYDYNGEIPEDKFYALSNKSSEAKSKLCQFLAAERAAGKLFHFLEDLKKYCFNDAYILASAMTRFEQAFEELTDVCLLEEAVTIAAAAIKSFRRKHLRSLHPIALDSKPSASYNSSIKSQKYLLWLQHKEKVHIAISTTSGEKKIGAYRVDGFIEKCAKYESGQIIEYFGCFWHGHTCQFAADSIIGDVQARDIWERDAKRIKKLEESYPVKIIWECEVDKQLKEDPEMAAFFENTEAKELLQMQRALMGGRTEVFKICADNKDVTVHFVDVVSLYPFVMKHRQYPIGKPTDVPPSEIKMPIETPEDLPFRGFLQCKILAPQDLLLPVLGDKAFGKFVFGLCRRCCKTQNQGECTHKPSERAFTGVYSTAELEEALSHGYKILEVFHGIEYKYWLGNDEEGNGGLFTSYVNDNMREKIHATGFPAHVQTNEDQLEFIKTYAIMEQIELVQKNFMKNPGRRAVAKLMLNSLWGKFAQRVDRIQNEIIMDPSKLFRILHDTSLEVLNVRPVNDTLIIQYRTRDELQSSLRTSAGHIAALTTAYGRLELYRLLEKVGGENIVYCDTDSLIYTVPKGAEDPLKEFLGSNLGQLTSELKGELLKFVATGPKSYSSIEKMENDQIKPKVKAKGITLNTEADKLLTFETMDGMVDEVLKEVTERTIVEVPQFVMKRNRKHQVFAKNIIKSFKFTFNKRKVLPDGSTLPFGYKK